MQVLSHHELSKNVIRASFYICISCVGVGRWGHVVLFLKKGLQPDLLAISKGFDNTLFL